MPVMPGARYRPVAWAEKRDDNTAPTCVILHLTASEATSQYGYFTSQRNACSNFHVARDGTIEQYINTDKLSAADGEGSDHAISVETQGADAGGRWTGAQVESIAKILAWAHATHPIPLRLMNNSKAGEKGVGWHRIGIDGNFPPLPNILAGRLQRGGGQKWSSSRGKVCPGDARIRQVPAVLARAVQLAGAQPAPEPPAPTPSLDPEDAMICLRNTANGAVIFVVGGVGVKLLTATIYGDLQKAGVPAVNCSPEQFAIFQQRFGA
jgi:N-acetylmuramoyl-L-alanine amidase